MSMMDFNANNSYRLSICVDKSVFTTIETAQCDVQFYLVNSLLSKCLGTFTLGPPVMSSGTSTPGNPVSFGGHPGGLMGLLSHAGVAGSNPTSGLQQSQQVNMVPRRGYPAGRARPRNTYNCRKRTITLKRQKPPPPLDQRHQSGGMGMMTTQVPSTPHYSTSSTTSHNDNQVSSILSQLDRDHVNIISDDDDFEIQEINSKDSPKVKQQHLSSSCRPTDLSRTSSSNDSTQGHSEPKMPRLDPRVRGHHVGSTNNPVGVQSVRSSVDENMADTDSGVETMTMVGHILDAVQATQDLSSFFIKTQPEDEFIPDRVVSLNEVSPVRPLQSLLNSSSLSDITQSQLSSNDTKPDTSNSSQAGFLVEPSSSLPSSSRRFQESSREVKIECNEVSAGSCEVTQKKQVSSGIGATDLSSPSIVNVSSVSDADQRTPGQTTFPIEDESEDPIITDVIAPSTSDASTSEAPPTNPTTSSSSSLSSSQQGSNANSNNMKTLSCEICEYKTTSVKRMRLHYNYAHGAEVDEEKLT